MSRTSSLTPLDVPVEPIVPEALYTWPDVRRLTKLSREYWRQLGLKNKAPCPFYFAGKAYWRGYELVAWCADPRGYQAPARSDDLSQTVHAKAQIMRLARAKKAGVQP